MFSFRKENKSTHLKLWSRPEEGEAGTAVHLGTCKCPRKKIIPVAGLSPLMVCMHTLSETPTSPVAVCPGSFSAGGRLQLLSGRHRLPWSYDSAWAAVCTTTQPLFPNRLARGYKHHKGKYLCAVGLAGGWGHGGRWAPVMGLAKICPPIRCPGAKATQPLQHKVQRFGWSRGWQQVHINMPPSALKPLKCKDRFVSNCSGESGLLGALTF